MSSLDAHVLIFDVQAVSWSQDGDADRFSDAPELRVVPPVYDVQPFEREIVRVALEAPLVAGDRERAYQLRFREVLQPGSHDAARTLIVPVFVAPSQRSGGVRYELQRVGQGQARLIVRNDSNEHVNVAALRIESGGDNVYSARPGLCVLAGNTRSFLFTPARPLQAAQVKVVVSTGDAETFVDVPVR